MTQSEAIDLTSISATASARRLAMNDRHPESLHCVAVAAEMAIAILMVLLAAIAALDAVCAAFPPACGGAGLLIGEMVSEAISALKDYSKSQGC